MEVRFHADVEDPLFAFALRNELGHTVFATSTQLQYGPTGRFVAGRVGDRAPSLPELAGARPLPADGLGHA